MAATPREPIVLHGFTLGLPLRVLQVDLVGGAQRKPEFLALNRFAQVPVINDNGTVIADSNAILTYLALRYAPGHWLPREPLAAARVQRWLSVAAGPLARSASVARAVNVFRRDVDTTAAVTEAQQLFTRMDAEIQASWPSTPTRPTHPRAASRSSPTPPSAPGWPVSRPCPASSACRCLRSACEPRRERAAHLAPRGIALARG